MNRVLSENRTLTSLDISGNLMNPREGAELAMAVRGNKVLRQLNISRFNLPVQELLGTAPVPMLSINFSGLNLCLVDIFFIAKCLRVNQVLKYIDLSRNDVRNEGAHAIARSLQHNTTLEGLRLDKFMLPIQAIRGSANSRKLLYPSKNLHTMDFIVMGELLRKNTDARELDLRGNDMFQTTEINCISQALSVNHGLQKLTFIWNTFGPPGMVMLSNALKHHPTVTDLQLRANGIGPDEGAQALADLVATNTVITTLTCVLNSLSGAGTRKLAQGLLSNNTITSLNLRNNLLKDEGATALSVALHRHSPLTDLNLRENKFGADGMHELADALHSETCPVETLNLAWNKIGVNGANSIADMLRLNSRLSKLDVSSTKIHSEGAAAIGAMLRVNRIVRHLNVACSTVGTRGALAIADALKYNRSVEVVILNVTLLPVQDLLGTTGIEAIDLSSQHLCDQDVAFVAETLKSNRVCTSLDVSHNPINNTAAVVLNEALQHNVVLTSLKFDQHTLAVQDLFGSTGALAISFRNQTMSELDSVFIAETLKVNTPMSTLDLTNCGIGPLACQHLGEALEVNGALGTLRLGHNSFGLTGAKALAAVLRADNVLQVLDLTGNDIGIEGTEALAKAVKDNWILSYLRIDTFPLPVQDLRGSEDTTTIDYSYHDLCMYDVVFITQLLKQNKIVTHLDLSGNELRNTSARSVSDMLKVNRFLQSVVLLDNAFNSVVGHFFVQCLAHNRVINDVLLDSDAATKRTGREIQELLELNRRFEGKFDGAGRLVKARHRFLNGDVLRFEGDESLQGYEARGTYSIASVDCVQALLIVLCIFVNFGELILSIIGSIVVAASDGGGPWLAFCVPVLIVVAMMGFFMLWHDNKRGVAPLQVVGLAPVKWAGDVLRRKVVPNATIDIRNETPIFAFVPFASLRTLEGAWRAAPFTLFFAYWGASRGWSALLVIIVVACVLSWALGYIMVDLHYVRTAEWAAALAGHKARVKEQEAKRLAEDEAARQAFELKLAKARGSTSTAGTAGADNLKLTPRGSGGAAQLVTSTAILPASRRGGSTSSGGPVRRYASSAAGSEVGRPESPDSASMFTPISRDASNMRRTAMMRHRSSMRNTSNAGIPSRLSSTGGTRRKVRLRMQWRLLPTMLVVFFRLIEVASRAAAFALFFVLFGYEQHASECGHGGRLADTRD